MRKTNLSYGNWAILLACLCVTFVATQANWTRWAELGQQALIAQIAPKQASGQVHIVELDAKSVAAAQRWPWSRDHYARMVRQLDEAGARSIVFDVALSSAYDDEGDAALARALSEVSTPVVLPTFSQNATETSTQRLDDLPLPAFREATTLASASVRPDADARVRRMVYGTVTNGVARPSMSAQIAGVSGAAGAEFAIDYSVTPSTIPRHSFADVENGTFDRQSVAGKDIIVGATAIELGDRYGVPIHGVIPGVTIQALAAETLIGGAFLEAGLLPLALVALPFAYWLLLSHSYRAITLRLAAGAILVIGCQAFAYHGLRIMADAVPALTLLVIVAGLQVLRRVRAQLRAKAMIDSASGLPNALAFSVSDHCEEQLVATAYIKQFDAIQAVIGNEELGTLIQRLVDRIKLTTAVEHVFHTDTRIIAWKHTGDHRGLIEQFEQLEKAFLKPLEVSGKRVDVALAFGIAAGKELSAASRAASDAVREDKLWHAHEDAEAAMVEQRVSLMGELDEAIGAGELSVVYQPKLCLQTDTIKSVEALVRWQHPTRGFMRPDLFIPLAEETKRIEPLTLFVLKQTIRDLHAWCADNLYVSAAVNISAQLISSEGFVSAVENILRETGVPRDRLIFEVTESATMRDPEVAARNLERFRDLGVAISMDDYGTGQSTLSYLQLLPLTELKIDRAFVEHAHIDRGDALLVRSSIQLAHSLGLRVVCEGVEEKECLDFLREAGCDYAQGYFVSKPLPASELVEKLVEISTEIAAEDA